MSESKEYGSAQKSGCVRIDGRQPYPLSPMQNSMLYQSMLAEGSPEHAGYNIEQVHIALPEVLDWSIFSAAWNEVLNRHPALTSCFKWRGVTKPEQASQDALRVPLSVVYWLDGDIAARRRDFLHADRQRGFRLDAAPLMRVTAAVLSGGRSEIFWTVHHILLDGRSFAPLLPEVFGRYAEKRPAHAPLPVAADKTYADYIHWRELHDHGPGLAFFRNLLAGKNSPTPLPLAEAKPRLTEVPEYHEQQVTLDTAVHASLSGLAREHQTTLHGILQAAWGVLLARLTGDMDVVCGVTRTTRRTALAGQGADIVGLMINTLPVRVKVNDGDTLSELLAATRRQWLAQRGHNETPLMDVQSQSELGPGIPLFEALLMYDNCELNRSLRDMDPAWEPRHVTVHEQPSTPLNLLVTESGSLRLKLLFDRRRYSDDAIARLLRYLQATLASMVSARTVGDIDILPDDERRQIVHEWNDTARAWSDTLLIHQLFEARADAAPEAVAVEVDGHPTTFGELERRANQLAHALRGCGLMPGRYVGICLSRGLDLVVALLGVAKSGAAYLPIDPEYPRERIAFMIEDAQAALVVTEKRYAELFAGEILSLDDAEVRKAATERPGPRARPDDVCYTIYTSGSTGQPKGVVLTHGAVVNTLEWVSRSFEVGPGDRALFVTSHCFDLSVYDVFGVLGAGATVVVATSALLSEPRELVRTLCECGITIWDSAPAALQRLVALFPPHGEGGAALRLVMLSGDWIPLTLPDAVRGSFPRAQVMSLGGATEAAIWSNWFPVGAIDPSWVSIPYGRPIQNSQYYVLDQRRKPVPAGVSGDLYIAGTCLAEGYLNRPELTAERFVSNPFRPGERMYMTGDLARYFPDGNLEFLGRADFQVKIRGYRIELGEIETALLAIPAVRDSLCSAFTDVSGAKALVAYITAKDGQSLDEAEVKQQLARTLPDYMLPACVMVLPAMPVSANGKVDRKALPSPLATTSAHEYVAPQTDIEKRMAALWEKLLERELIGLDDHFFDLGGNSLLAVSLVVAVEQEFDTRIPLTRVLECPTLGTMAQEVAAPAPAPRRGHVNSFNIDGKRAPLFLFSGAGGFGFFFYDLAKRLEPDQPVHIVHAIGADDESESSEHSIEEMAAIYLEEINDLCPKGPLVTGGYSSGILVAYEVARSLQALGRQVPMLVSFDGGAPGYPRLGAQVRQQITNFRQLEGSARCAYLWQRIVSVVQRIRSVGMDAEFEEHLALDDIDPQVAVRMRRVATGLVRAHKRYKPAGRIDARMLLLRTQIPFGRSNHRSSDVYDWDKFLRGPVEVVPLPATHLDFFGDVNNSIMADAIHQYVDGYLTRLNPASEVTPSRTLRCRRRQTT